MTTKPESRLVTKILARLRSDGWLVTKTHGGAFTDAGIPDILGWRDGVAVGIEVKVGDNEPTELQKRWLKQLGSQGVRVGVARSVDDAVGICGGSDERYDAH